MSLQMFADNMAVPGEWEKVVAASRRQDGWHRNCVYIR